MTSPLAGARDSASCVSAGRLYVSTADGKLHRLAARGDAWEEAGEAKQPRVAHRLVSVNGKYLLAIGGAARGDNLDSLEAIEAKASEQRK